VSAGTGTTTSLVTAELNRLGKFTVLFQRPNLRREISFDGVSTVTEFFQFLSSHLVYAWSIDSIKTDEDGRVNVMG
jgi:hypothetical protein